MLSWASAQATVTRGDRDAALFAGKTLLVIGTGGPKRGPVLERVRSLGLAAVLCLNDEPNWAAPYIDTWILADPTDPVAALAAVLAYQEQAEAKHIDGVITFDEFSVQVAAEIAEKLGLVGTTRQVANRVRNKLAFRQFCHENGLPTPRAVALVGNATAALASIRNAGLQYPLIFKPQCGGGSALVRKVADEQALMMAIKSYTKEVGTQPLSRSWGDAAAFVEEYLDGPEVDVDMLIQGGEVRYCEVTDNSGTSEPYFLETGGCFPSALDDRAQQALREMAMKVVTALGIQDGCIHFEAKVTPMGPIPIEVNMRLGGAEVFAFHRAAQGVDLAAEAVKIALGAPLATKPGPLPRRYLASVNFVPMHGGKLEAIDIDPALWHAPELVEIVIFGELGMRIAVPPEGYQYLGWLVASGTDPKDARCQVERLAKTVKFTI